MNCTRCGGTGVLNGEQIPDADMKAIDDAGDDWCEAMWKWIAVHAKHDVQVCDCCGDGDNWYGEPGEHDESEYGPDGPYAYNGGLPECY